jgi:hypothetical protein
MMEKPNNIVLERIVGPNIYGNKKKNKVYVVTSHNMFLPVTSD